MIAAAIPTFYFELDSFSAVMPRHWKQPLESEPGKPMEDPAWVGVRDGAQARPYNSAPRWSASSGERKASATTKKDVWPEYAELSCFACHHSLGPAADSWRQKHEYRRTQTWRSHVERFALRRLSLDGRASGQCISAGIGKAVERGVGGNEQTESGPQRRRVAATAAAQSRSDSLNRLAGMQYDSALASTRDAANQR